MTFSLDTVFEALAKLGRIGNRARRRGKAIALGVGVVLLAIAFVVGLAYVGIAIVF